MEVTQGDYVAATFLVSLGLGVLVAALVWLAVRGCDDSNWIDDDENEELKKLSDEELYRHLSERMSRPD